jgi:transposase-like protein
MLFGIHHPLIVQCPLRNWVKQSRIDAQPKIEGALTSAEQQELVMLRRELKHVRMERDFLKKAATFGSTDPIMRMFVANILVE